MKTYLTLLVSSVVTAGVLPSLPAKIILSAFVLMAALIQTARRAPVGYEDGGGFHLIRERRAATKGRAKLRLWPTRKRLLIGWLLSDSHQPAKA